MGIQFAENQIMTKRITDNRFVLLAVGLAAGLCLSYFWPHEPVLAGTVDRDSKFAIVTCPVSNLRGVEGVFVLDFLTGRLTGGVINNRHGQFQHSYGRNIAADFNVNPKLQARYAIVSGSLNMNSRRQFTPASGVLYVAEMNSGQVICYTFHYTQTDHKLPQLPLVPVDRFQFREATQ